MANAWHFRNDKVRFDTAHCLYIIRHPNAVFAIILAIVSSRD
jgi:hypothetical protein